MSFDYLLDKIRLAPVTSCPYDHIYIGDFFNAEHLSAITAAPEIRLSGVGSDQQLFDSLFANGYKIIDFPGCITDREAYMRWHKDKNREHRQNNSACEGFGMTVRLTDPRSDVLNELLHFMGTDAFEDALAGRFGIDQSNVRRDFGIQKYLDGYEISPHPDIRQKALTYMVNINPSKASEGADHHTHYLKFRPEYKYVQAYWEGNRDVNRCWGTMGLVRVGQDPDGEQQHRDLFAKRSEHAWRESQLRSPSDSADSALREPLVQGT